MKDVLKLALEAGFDCSPDGHIYTDSINGVCDEELERFAALVAAAEQKKWFDQTEVEIHEAVLDEREACAKVCETLPFEPDGEGWTDGVNMCADAIRARSNT